jgi:hypothetical protein
MISRGTNALGIKITLNSGRHKRGICLETIPKSDKTYETVSLTLNSLRSPRCSDLAPFFSSNHDSETDADGALRFRVRFRFRFPSCIHAG